MRDEWIREEGFKILRFWNNDVLKNRDGVMQIIIEQLKSPLPSPPHSFVGGGNERCVIHLAQFFHILNPLSPLLFIKLLTLPTAMLILPKNQSSVSLRV